MTMRTAHLLDLPAQLEAAIGAAAGDMEAGRDLPEKLVRELRDSGAFRLLTPRELGGFEAPLETVLKVYEGFGRLDASAGWIVWNANWGFIGALLDEPGNARIWGSGPEPVFAASSMVGTAVPCDGGYRLSGHWKLVSGINHADWFAAAAYIKDGDNVLLTDDGMLDVRFFMLRREQLSVKDTWHSGGLRGSGSHSVMVEDAVVPGDLVARVDVPARVQRPRYQGYIPSLVVPGCSAVVLGVAQSAIEETAALVVSKRTMTGGTLAASAHTQTVIARSEAALQAARLLLLAAARDLDLAGENATPVTLELRAALRAAMSHAAQTSRDVLTAMYELGSSASIYQGNSVERLFRDGMVALQHHNHSAVFFESVGRVRLGMAPTQPVF
ncbi:acyl-CoA dehydrogenase family protein [Nonomuraea sp. NPDC048882]|uniref:acyl-CoA dehydrogenase family protein n=1 Tax=Nonomuraea sp. NPDC048882 TaxID=3154347 RepID=UPI000AE97CB3